MSEDHRDWSGSAGLRKDGTTFPLHLSIAELADAGERKFTGILHDLSDRVRMEGQLREREALARLGEMAAVIAHEVKNPLAGIRGAIQVFGGRMIQDVASTSILTEIVARIDSLDRMMKACGCSRDRRNRKERPSTSFRW